ncbi:MAG: hypothetical protein QOK48_2225 [Blastocatellia bacterium]|nr:hypothetical protein [Blastocatellia bacterium]
MTWEAKEYLTSTRPTFYREAVNSQSPGLPRFAATLGSEQLRKGTLKGLGLRVLKRCATFSGPSVVALDRLPSAQSISTTLHQQLDSKSIIELHVWPTR